MRFARGAAGRPFARGGWTFRAGGAAPGREGGRSGTRREDRREGSRPEGRLRKKDRGVCSGWSIVVRRRRTRAHAAPVGRDFDMPGGLRARENPCPDGHDSGTLRPEARSPGRACAPWTGLPQSLPPHGLGNAGEGRPAVARAAAVRRDSVRTAFPAPHDAAAGRSGRECVARTGASCSGNGPVSSDVGRTQGTLRAAGTPRYRTRSGCDRPVPEGTGRAVLASATALCTLGICSRGRAWPRSPMVGEGPAGGNAQ